VGEYSRRLEEFNDLVIRRVYAEIEYPRAAVRRSLQGALELDVTIDADGALTGVVVARSSGYRMLDGSAVRAATRGLQRIDPDTIDPVAVAEYGTEGGELVIPVPVTFRLQ
jgi:protein TonB